MKRSARAEIACAARSAGWKRSVPVSAFGYDVWTREDGAELQVDFYDDEPSQVTGTFLPPDRSSTRKSDDVETIVGWLDEPVRPTLAALASEIRNNVDNLQLIDFGSPNAEVEIVSAAIDTARLLLKTVELLGAPA